MLVHEPAVHDSDRFPWVLIAPGYSASVGTGFWVEVAQRIVDRGYGVVGCQFSGSGFGDDLLTVSELDAFARNTYGKDLEDLAEAAAWARSQAGFDSGRSVVFGHSRGGGMSVVHAAEDRRHSGVVTWNGIDSILRFTPERLQRWRDERQIEVMHWGARRRVALGREVLADAERHRERYEPLAAAARCAAPLLVVQGEADEAVTPDCGRRLVGAAGERGTFHLVPGGDHAFGMRTRRVPETTTEAFENAMAATLEFLDAVFRRTNCAP